MYEYLSQIFTTSQYEITLYRIQLTNLNYILFFSQTQITILI